MTDLYLGIDMGTSAVKIVLIDEMCRMVSQASEPCQVISLPDGGSEIDPEHWYQSMRRGLQNVLSGQEACRVRSICVTGQMHSLSFLDEKGAVLRPSVLWNDTRARDLIPEMKERYPFFRDGSSLSGVLSTGTPAAILYWLRQTEPEVYGELGHILIGSAWLVYCLTGSYTADYCNASTSCLCEKSTEGQWSLPICSCLQLRPEVLPPICGSAQTAGLLKDPACRRLGLSEEVRVLVGTGDNAAAAIAAERGAGQLPLISLGTSGVLVFEAQKEQEVVFGKKFLFSEDGITFRAYVQGVVQSCGAALSWWMKDILEEQDFSCLDSRIHLKEQAGNAVLFYPHLNGDKTLYADPELRGAFLGLSQSSRREDLLYAVLEGLCFAIREVYEKTSGTGTKLDGEGAAQEILVTGGAAASRVWMQTLANVLQHQIRTGGSLCDAAGGAALLAANVRFLPCKKGENAPTHPGVSTENSRRFAPDPEMSAACSRKYQRYLRIHDALRSVMAQEAPLS